MTPALSWLFKLVDGLIPKTELPGSEETVRNARIVYSALLLILINDLVFGLLGIAQGDKVLPWIVLGCGAITSLAPILHRKYKSIKIAGSWIAWVSTILLITTCTLSGGIYSSALAWFGALVVFIIVTQGSKMALIWTITIAVFTILLWWLPEHGIILPDYENPVHKSISWAIAFPSGLFLILCILHGFFEAHRRAIRNLDRQAKALLIQAKELGLAKNEAEAASKSRSEFIATVSHEIRTPMNGILGVTQLMNGTNLSNEQQKYMEALKMSAEGLLSILGDILDFSKIEAGKLEVQAESFHLKQMCQESISIFAGIAQSKKLQIQLVFETTLPNFVLGDPIRIRQILLNLIGNSVKFTEQGVITLSVELDKERKDWVNFSVRDAGIGMSETTLKILFQPYTQADASSSRKYGGTGLGLAICNRLVVLMGGKISVESQLGHGSCFHISLPLPATSPNQEIITSVVRSEETSNPGNMRILLAEDNAVNRMVAIKMLEKLKVKVEIAINGIEAVKSWQAGNFDLIFMDCQMPGMDGYEASRTIRNQEKNQNGFPRIPIVALTAHAMEEDRIKCLDSGMDAYLTKPVKSESLREALRTWIKAKSIPRTLQG
jgi:signal transduction histidine kinase/CheY-like chemotaxis protein